MTTPETAAPRLATAIGARPPLVRIGAGEPLTLPRPVWIEIDLDAVVHNLSLFRAALPPSVRVEPVVKADAYGHGAVAVARALAGAGVAGFAVATYDEALELRQAGIEGSILVLYPIPPELVGGAIRHSISVTASDRVLLARTIDALAALSPEDATRRLSIHLEVETGLGRGGLHPDEIPGAVETISATPRARLVGLWSHLQDAGDRERTAGQARRFGHAESLLEEVSTQPPARHIAASGGVLAAHAPACDAVRIGLSLYGLVPDGLVVDERYEPVARGLQPVMSLRARPVRVTMLPPGTGVSYGPSFVTARETRVATLPLGYADGWPRSLSNRAQVLVRGVRAPMIGTVAMDAVMVDVTDVPGEPVTIDDDFTLIGRQGEAAIDAVEVGRWGNTISYEIVAAMSARLPRVYYAAAEPVALRTLAHERVQPEGHRRRPATTANEGPR